MENFFTPDARIMIVSPHPDDEIIGAGARLPLVSDCTIVQVTDGAPRDLVDARAAGFGTQEEYAAARVNELRQALAIAWKHTQHRPASIAGFELIELQLPDQRASFHLTQLTERLHQEIVRFAPEFVVTVPYEGGHPDHDATAFAVHHACQRIDAWERPRLVEMLAYHNQCGACEIGCFLDESGDVLVFELSAGEREFKRRLFDCFETQQHVLKWFPVAVEKFRSAPRYDFTQPPHEGQLYYELFSWGMDGPTWTQLALRAQKELACLSAF